MFYPLKENNQRERINILDPCCNENCHWQALYSQYQDEDNEGMQSYQNNRPKTLTVKVSRVHRLTCAVSVTSLCGTCGVRRPSLAA